MIIHTPRADPMASASPQGKGVPPSQLRVPITPNRYRASSTSSNRQALPSASSSRRSPVVGGKGDASPRSQASSNWATSIELSLTTRRRLIRKPLPQLPTANAGQSTPAYDPDSNLIDSSALNALYFKAESWWPESLPEKHDTASTASATSSRFSTNAESETAQDPNSNEGHGLDEQSLRHLLYILHHAALRYESAAGADENEGTLGRNVVVSANGTYKKQADTTSSAASTSVNGANEGIYVLDDATLDSLYRALQAAFRHLSQRQVLGALQRTASIRWRAEAQLRNATAAQAAEANSALSSRWARFAWPAAALGRAYKEAQKSVLPPFLGDVPSSAFSTASNSHFNSELYSGLYSDPDHRIRKRDVAVKILSNAIWFVRNYGPDAGVETLPGSEADASERDASSNAADGLPAPSLFNFRRTSENLLKKNAGLPTFLPKSSATTALSGTATPESIQSERPATLEAPLLSGSAALSPSTSDQGLNGLAPNTSANQLPRAASQTTLDSINKSPSASGEIGVSATSEASTEAMGASSPTSPGEKSKAMEQLASLSAAAGAAMRQKAQQAAALAAANGGKPEDAVDAVVGSSAPLKAQSSRPSLRSFVGRSDAEAAETDALEKAEHDYLDQISQGCDEWAKMVVCRLCAAVQVGDHDDKAKHCRSGTITAKDVTQAKTMSEDSGVGSSISTRSDRTARAVQVNSSAAERSNPLNMQQTDDQGQEPVVWKPDVFDGEELFANQGHSSHERRASFSQHDEDTRIRFVGGSFVCRVQTEDQRQALVELLEIALYVGMSMLLESSFLIDSDAARPKTVKPPPRTSSTADTRHRGTSSQGPVFSRSSSRQSLSSGQRSVSNESQTSLVSAIGPSGATDAETHDTESSNAKAGARKWTKGLWGRLGHSTEDANTSDGHNSLSPRKSSATYRHAIDDEESGSPSKSAYKVAEEPQQSIAARKAALFASVSKSSAPSVSQSSTSKPNRLVGRLMNAFNRPTSSEPTRPDTSEATAMTTPLSTTSRQTSSQLSLDTEASRSRAHKPAFLRSLRDQAKPASLFPVKGSVPAAAALSTSPELSMLLCYQYQKVSFQGRLPTAVYLTAFYRLQALRFLADQRREHVTFGAPSHGISSSGDLLPFVGVQKASLSAWSMISSRSQQQHQSSVERPHANSVQLLSYELLSGDGAALGLCREEVAFYQRLSNSRDVPLGQVIEELSIRACALEADRDSTSKTSDSRLASGKFPAGSNAGQQQVINSAYGMPEQRLQFIHGSCRIRIMATVLPSRLYEVGPDVQHKADSDVERDFINSKLEIGSATVSPSLQPTKSRESDVSAIAAASNTDQEAANTAFAVAETAVQAAEKTTSRPLVDQIGSASTSGIWMWNASAKSGWQGKATPMSESTYLLSFARYLEAISYHPALRRAAGLEPVHAKAYGGLSNVQQQLRQGRSEDARSVAEGPDLLRFFRSGRSLVKVQVQPLVLYDLQIEGPCLKTSSERRRERKQKQAQADKRRFKHLAEETRLEIQRFFASIKSNTTKLEDVFVSRELDEAGKTIRQKSTPDADSDSKDTASASSTVSDQVAEPLTLLTNLRSSLRSDEFELYEALQRTLFLDGINDIRKAFADRAKSAKNRLAAWVKKHLTKKEQADFGGCSYDEPEYLGAGRHAFPGSSYVIRDDEPLSIIAFSLSSRDFRAEMGTLPDRRQEAAGYLGSSNDEHVKQWRRGVLDDDETGTIGSVLSSASTATATSSLLKDRAMRKVPMSQLDPDKDEVFFDAEPVRAALKRKKRGREASILSLTLRRVGSTISENKENNYKSMQANGRPGSSASSLKDQDDDDDDDLDDDDDADLQSSIVHSTTIIDQDKTLDARRIETLPLSKAGLKVDTSMPPPSQTKVRPSGSVTALRNMFEIRSQSSFSSIPDRKSSRIQSSTQTADSSTISSTNTDTFHAEISPISGRAASLASIFSSTNRSSEAADSRIKSGAPPSETETTPKKATPQAIPRSRSATRRGSMTTETASARGTRLSISSSPMKRDSNSSQRSATQQSSTSGTGGEALGADAQSMISNSTMPGSQAAESPHIKHNLVHGTTKISCVSWFAEEFAALRERWGVEHDFAHSLSRCQPWAATGGKSKSAFFKTADERFIAKQLLTVWSVDEKEAFLEFAPAYIRYMMNSILNDCPTLLVKIAGVYTIKIKDLKSGENKLKMNVMLLENLWAGDGGQSVRFDLKGIRDRKVKLSAEQQQRLQQAAASGSPVVDSPGASKGGALEGSASAMWNAGVHSVTSEADPARSSAQTSPSRAGDSSKKAGDPNGAGSESKTSPSASSTVWWDSEWIERYRHRAFVSETQKEVFFRALQNDTRFLTASNVMDYSLLLGVMERPVRQDDMYPPAAAAAGVGLDLSAKDSHSEARTELEAEASEKPSFRCRIVDFLGAFTLAKQLESSSKKALKGQDARGNVTILPPSEYANRFLTAIDSYFIGTPCQPRLDPGYAFDAMCEQTAQKDKDAIRRPRLASVL